ncbi:MAG: adenylate/guanylate cyclase domain-containing protein [Acidobacteria bacterium]|nr:adenylate/guanylate cyclase domain-containing protein [Acidobacteriota bacterium]
MASSGSAVPMRLLAGAAIAIAAAVLSGLIGLTGLARTAELKLYDWRVRLTATGDAGTGDAGTEVPALRTTRDAGTEVPALRTTRDAGTEVPALRTTRDAAPIVLVTVDDDSLKRMEPLVGRWPWPRLVHAFLIDYLAAGGAKAVVYDVLFAEADRSKFMVGDTEWTGEESDQALVDSTAAAGNVIHVAEAASAELVDPTKAVAASLDDVPALNLPFVVDDCVERRPQVTPPFPALARAARAIGHSLVVYDQDGPLRRVVPFVRVGQDTVRVIPSLPLAAMMMAGGLGPEAVGVEAGVLRIGATRIPLVTEMVPDYYGPPTPACRALLPWRGPARRRDGTPTFPTYSFYDLFYSQQQVLEDVAPLVSPETFRDKIVVVGVAGEGLRDVFVTPFAEGRMPGAEIHANTIDAWRAGRTLTPARAVAGGLVVVGAALAVGATGVAASAWFTGGVALVLALAYTWLNVHLFAAGAWWPIALPLLAMMLAFVGELAWQYFVEGREKRQVKRLFSRYVAKDVYDQLLADPARARLGGTRREMSVLFSDMRGFTALTERGRPEDIVSQLNDYFTRMVQVLFEHRGTLDKFVGDMVMALFGAPLDDEDHAEHAVQTALAMVRALDLLNAEWAGFGIPRLDIGIGINTGEMVAGNIGSSAIMSYTVIGDAVNLGARLESLNKEYGTRIIISEATRAQLKGQYDIRPLGSVTVKGKSQSVAIYEVRPS